MKTDLTFGQWIAAFFLAVVLLVVFVVVSAWFITIGYNDCGLYKFLGTASITYQQAVGAAIVTLVLGQLFRLGPR